MRSLNLFFFFLLASSSLLSSITAQTCVTQAQLQAINEDSTYWPRCDPSSSKTNSGPGGYVFGDYCTQEWADELNEVLVELGYCNDGLIIRKFLAQVAYESGLYTTLNQPLDDGSGLIHMIPANWNINVNDMEEVFPGQGLRAAFDATSDKQGFFKNPKYAWKSAAAWYKRTNRVVRNCGFDLFPSSYDEQTRCILSIVVDRSEVYDIVARHIPCSGACDPTTGGSGGGNPTPPPPPSPNGGGGTPTNPNIRCGTSWSNANNKCGDLCTTNAHCSGGETCWADLPNSCAPPPPPVPPPSNGGPSNPNIRCGTSWSNANNKCGDLCTTNAHCSGGETCWADLPNSCAPPPPPPPSSTVRCGSSWSNANQKCGVTCSIDGDCPGSERCWASLSLDPCNAPDPIVTTPSPSPYPSALPTSTPSPTPFPTSVPSPSPTPTSVPSPTPTPTSVPSPTPVPTPVPTPTPVNSDIDNNDYFWRAVFCYFSEQVCDYVELLEELSRISGNAVIVSYGEQCDTHENMCVDYGLWEFDRKRGERRQQGEQRSVMLMSTGFVSQTEADVAFDRVMSALGEAEEGVLGEVGVREIECSGDECVNQCHDCELEGKWHREQIIDGSKMRMVLEVKGGDENGRDEEVVLKEYWDFQEGGRCVGTWMDGKSRFYSTDFDCNSRIVLESNCAVECDERVGEGNRDKVCDGDNVQNFDAFLPVSFSGTCSSMSRGGERWREGEGVSVLYDDSDSGAAGRTVGLFGVIVGFLVLFFGF